MRRFCIVFWGLAENSQNLFTQTLSINKKHSQLKSHRMSKRNAEEATLVVSDKRVKTTTSPPSIVTTQRDRHAFIGAGGVIGTHGQAFSGFEPRSDLGVVELVTLLSTFSDEDVAKVRLRIFDDNDDDVVYVLKGFDITQCIPIEPATTFSVTSITIENIEYLKRTRFSRKASVANTMNFATGAKTVTHNNVTHARTKHNVFRPAKNFTGFGCFERKAGDNAHESEKIQTLRLMTDATTTDDDFDIYNVPGNNVIDLLVTINMKKIFTLKLKMCTRPAFTGLNMVSYGFHMLKPHGSTEILGLGDIGSIIVLNNHIEGRVDVSVK
jgi:hypothetical protein